MGFKKGVPPSIVDFYDLNINGKDAHGRTLRQILDWDDTKLERCHDYIQILFPLPEGSMFSFDAPIIDRETIEAFRSRVSLRIALSAALARMLSFYGLDMCSEFPGSFQRPSEQKQAGKAEQDQQPATGTGKGKGKGKAKAEDESSEPAADKAQPDKEDSGINPIDPDAWIGRLNADTLMDLAKWPDDYPEVVEAIYNTLSGYGFGLIKAKHFEEAAKNWVVPMDHNHLRITRILRCLRVLGLQKQCNSFYEALKGIYEHPKYKIGQRSMMFWERAVRQPLHIAPDGTEVDWLLTWVEHEQTQD